MGGTWNCSGPMWQPDGRGALGSMIHLHVWLFISSVLTGNHRNTVNRLYPNTKISEVQKYILQCSKPECSIRKSRVNNH